MDYRLRNFSELTSDPWNRVAEFIVDNYGLDVTGWKLAHRLPDEDPEEIGDEIIALAEETFDRASTATSPTGYFLRCLENLAEELRRERTRAAALREEQAQRRRHQEERHKQSQKAREELRLLGFRSQPSYYFGHSGLFTGGPGDGTYNQDAPIAALRAVKEAEVEGSLPLPVLHEHRDLREARMIRAGVARWVAGLEADLKRLEDSEQTLRLMSVPEQKAIRASLASVRERLAEAEADVARQEGLHPTRFLHYL